MLHFRAIRVTCQKISHIFGLGQTYDLVIKVSHRNKITKVKNLWYRQIESMASISKTFILITNHVHSLMRWRGHLPLSPLATTYPIDGGGITSHLPPGHDSGTPLVTKSHILLYVEFNRGNFYLILPQG